jgi:hypothetical protein
MRRAAQRRDAQRALVPVARKSGDIASSLTFLNTQIASAKNLDDVHKILAKSDGNLAQLAAQSENVTAEIQNWVGSLRLAANQKSDEVVKPLERETIASVMEGVKPDARRHPKFYAPPQKNLVELYYDIRNEEMGKELKSLLEGKEAYVIPPIPRELHNLPRRPILACYYEEDRRLASNVGQVVQEYLDSHHVNLRMPQVEIDLDEPRANIQLGQVVVYLPYVAPSNNSPVPPR